MVVSGCQGGVAEAGGQLAGVAAMGRSAMVAVAMAESAAAAAACLACLLELLVGEPAGATLAEETQEMAAVVVAPTVVVAWEAAARAGSVVEGEAPEAQMMA